MTPQAIVFDLDDTLAKSKQPIAPSMAAALAALLRKMPVAIATGGTYAIVQENVVARLPEDADLGNLYLLPTCGAALYEYREGAWRAVYEETLSDKECEAIREGIDRALARTGVIDLAEEPFGERVEYRGSQVTLSALGQRAPLARKVAWDPDRTKRTLLRDAIAEELPQFSVKTGGTTSCDITKPGVDKAFGVRKLAEHLGIPTASMLYVGDALFPGGNDEVVKEAGVRTEETSGPEDTERIIGDLLA